jgi:UDP-N-acetylmuramoyl-L-alanyl-D-glutamate--2,6-diaminopimelate ligase
MTSRPDVEADWRLVPDEANPLGFALTDGSTTLTLQSALPGDFNRVNTALAALALLALGVPAGQVELACAAPPSVPGRMEPVALEGDHGLPRAVVDYAHTPDAVASALRALRPTTPGALVVVLGAGGDRDRGKRAAMGRAAAIRRSVLEGAREAAAGAELHEVGDRSAAIAAALAAAADAGAGSTVAVVGKGHETGQDVAGTIHPFDDREEVRKALQQLTGAREVGA